MNSFRLQLIENLYFQLNGGNDDECDDDNDDDDCHDEIQ